MQTITRKEALAQGLKRYTGRPCKYGHSGERFIDGSCVPCRLAQNAKWAARNPEKKAASYARWRHENREAIKEKQSEYHAVWYALNRERKLAQNTSYLKDNPDVARAATARWRARNPDVAAASTKAWYANPENNAKHHNARRARKLAAEGRHTADEIRAIKKAQNHRCAYCRADLRKVTKHLDHIMPLALGGSNAPDNLQWLCAPCNLSKGARDPIDFARERGFLI